MKITTASHLDHGLDMAVVALIAKRFSERSAFFIETFEIPEGLPGILCGLHGPIVGDAPVEDAEVVFEVRGDRGGPSRLCARPTRPTRTVTVIAGPHLDEPCVLYTAFGGPLAPHEPWEHLAPEDRVKSEAFWREHALSRGGS